MKIEAGKYYKNREGKKIYVAGICPWDRIRPVIGWTESVEIFISWKLDGHWAMSDTQHRYDLVSEWVDPMEVEFWVNVYKNNPNNHLYRPLHHCHGSKGDADRAADPDRITCIYVKGTEGVEK